MSSSSLVSGAHPDITPSSHRLCADILKMASHEPIMRLIVDCFGQTDDRSWESCRFPTPAAAAILCRLQAATWRWRTPTSFSDVSSRPTSRTSSARTRTSPWTSSPRRPPSSRSLPRWHRTFVCETIWSADAPRRDFGRERRSDRLADNNNFDA